MRTWYVESRAIQLGIAAFVLAVGTGLLWFGAITVILGISSESDSVANGVRVTLTSAMALLWIYGGTGYLRSVRELRVTDEGTVTLVRVIGSTKLSARNIWKLEGKYEQDEDGRQLWSLRIFHHATRRPEKLEEFVGATDFRDIILAHNPNVIIDGLWPEWAPPRPGNPSFVAPLGPAN